MKRVITIKQVSNNTVEELNAIRNRYFTFGVEIECFNVNKVEVKRRLEEKEVQAIMTGYNHIDQRSAYKLGDDGSICGLMGCEVVSPVLRNFNSLKNVCGVLNEHGAKVNESCGLHVHFGIKSLSCKQVIKLMLDYNKIQSLVSSFLPASRRNGRYCQYLTSNEVIRLKSLYLKNEEELTMEKVIDCVADRYRTVNIYAYCNHKTIEFRQHNGTTNYSKIRAWVLFLLSFINLSLKGYDFSHMVGSENLNDLPINRTIVPYLKKRQQKFFND